jgi:hypothetical protein
MTPGKGGTSMVQIASKQERGFWAASVITLIPDILVSAGGSYLLDWGGPGFFGILIGLQAVYFALWLKRALWAWLVFWISGRRKLADHLEEYLVCLRLLTTKLCIPHCGLRPLPSWDR